MILRHLRNHTPSSSEDRASFEEPVKAHAELDRAVDLCYRPNPFTNERQRVEYLFGRYEQLTAPLLPTAKPKRRRKVLRCSQWNGRNGVSDWPRGHPHAMGKPTGPRKRAGFSGTGLADP